MASTLFSSRYAKLDSLASRLWKAAAAAVLVVWTLATASSCAFALATTVAVARSCGCSASCSLTMATGEASSSCGSRLRARVCEKLRYKVVRIRYNNKQQMRLHFPSSLTRKAIERERGSWRREKCRQNERQRERRRGDLQRARRSTHSAGTSSKNRLGLPCCNCSCCCHCSHCSHCSHFYCRLSVARSSTR